MLRKPVFMLAIAATAATVGLSTPAAAQADPVLGALLGAGVGAAIGHSVSGRDGAWVGGALGAVTGASIANQSYYAPGYYSPAPTYYGPPARVYYAPPAPVYYSRPAYVAPYPVYYRWDHRWRDHRYYGDHGGRDGHRHW